MNLDGKRGSERGDVEEERIELFPISHGILKLSTFQLSSVNNNASSFFILINFEWNEF